MLQMSDRLVKRNSAALPTSNTNQIHLLAATGPSTASLSIFLCKMADKNAMAVAELAVIAWNTSRLPSQGTGHRNVAM